MQQGYKSKVVYNISGENGLVDNIKKMVLAGEDVCPDRSYAVGMGAYCISYVNKEEAKDAVVKPDWDKAKSFKGQENAKQLLIDYASDFIEVTEDTFDKRKGFDKLLAGFQGLYGAAKKREKAQLEDSLVYADADPQEDTSEE